MTAATARRASLLGFAAWALTACVPAADPGTATAPIVSASIVTPAPPTYRYSWVMVHHHQEWGVQIGPKVDGSGIHVAVYAWQSCAAAYTPCDWWFFHEYQALDAGSAHEYAITRTSDGWELLCDGAVVAVLDPGSADPITETGSELTRA